MNCSKIGHEHELRARYCDLWAPLWSNGQNSWQQMQRSGFDSRRYQIFWEVVGLERGPLSLVSIEELLYRKVSGSGLENRDHGRRGSAALTMLHISLRKMLELTLSISGGRSVSRVSSRTQATEFFFFFWYCYLQPLSIKFRDWLSMSA
jgi:hypothetical protein